jgi:hypothetical protein
MLGEAASGQRVDTNGNVQQLSKDQRIDTALAGGASLALQVVAAGSPATTALSVPGGAASQGGALALQTATVTVPSATAVAGAAGVAVPALATTGGGYSGGEKTEQDRRLTKQEVKQLEKNTGQGAHDIKGEVVGKKNGSKYDFFKNKDGEVIVKPKSGNGPGEPTGHSL